MPYAHYGWTVDIDHDHDRDPGRAAALGLSSRVGAVGPADLDPRIRAALVRGHGRRWRTLYDVDYDGQGRVERRVHEGRYLALDELEQSETATAGADELGPLEDFSGPDCGAAEIEYYENERWQPY